MPQAVWTPHAEAELEDIVFYIAVEGGRPGVAERIARELRDRANHVAETAALWRRHPDLTPNLFYASHKRWLIVFQEHPNGIEVLRVIDASRDFTRLFGGANE